MIKKTSGQKKCNLLKISTHKIKCRDKALRIALIVILLRKSIFLLKRRLKRRKESVFLHVLLEMMLNM